jgi:hypothetical protein
MDIPIVVICHNNHEYLENTLKQLKKFPHYYKNIIILNSNSTRPDTLEYLKHVDVKIHNNTKNEGPWITPNINRALYNQLPNKYILTDPDLEFNKNLPSNFIEILDKLGDTYNACKIGFALDISDFNLMHQVSYYPNYTISTWEQQFWKDKINNENYEMYYAAIDTTFCLCNKVIRNGYNIRVAGNFTAKHLPWYVQNDVLTIYDRFLIYTNQTKISTISHIDVAHINQNFYNIQKNQTQIFIKKIMKIQTLTFGQIYTKIGNMKLFLFLINI